MRIDVILEPDLGVDEICELGALAESLGIHRLWVQNYSSAMDPFMSLVPLARRSRRIGLGVVVVSPQELHPLKLANSVLTLNELSAGRAAVVIGRGGDWLGVIDGDYRPRVAPLREALLINRDLARGAGCEQAYSHAGEHYRARYFRTPWRQCRQAPVIYAGVTRDRMLAMAAQAADGAMLADLGLPAIAAGRIAVLERALAQAGRPRRDFIVSDFVGWHVKEDPAATYAEARRELIIRAWLGRWWLEQFLDPDEVEFVDQHRQAFVRAWQTKSGEIEGVPAALVDKLLDGFTITAPVAELDRAIERVLAFRDAGLDELALRVHDNPADAIRLIGERILPVLG